MASTYTSVVNIQGSSRRLYRGYLNATVSNINNTTSRISWTASVEMYNAYEYGVGVECSVGGTVRGSKTGYLTSNPGGSYRTVATTSGTTDYTRGTSAKSVTVTVRAYGITVSGYGSAGGSTSASVTVTIPALPSYTVAYNANGGSGAPGNQTKWYGQTLTLSSTKPSRTGYTFARWSANFGSGNVYFNPGAAYTYNSSATLYANWTANTWTVSYDANGGTGAPSAQTKIYGQTLVLSSTVPTRTNYNFLGWAISSTGSAVYQPGGNYTIDGAATLYAVWEIAYISPIITNVAIDRCDSSGVISDDGTYLKIAFSYQLDATYSGGMDYIQIGYKLFDADIYTNLSTYTPTAMVDDFSQVVGGGSIDTEYAYDVQVIVKDKKGSSTVTGSVGPLAYIIDFSPEGGIALGKPAPNTKSLEVDIPSSFDNGLTINMNDTQVATTTDSGYMQFTNHMQLANGMWLQGGLSSSGNFTNILRMSEDDRVELNWTQGGLSGRVMKLLWSGTLSEGGSVTIPDLPYYTMFGIGLSAVEHLGFAFKGEVPGIYPGRLAWDQNTNVLLGYGAYCTIEGTKFTYVKGRGVNVLAPSAWNVTIRIFTVYGVL